MLNLREKKIKDPNFIEIINILNKNKIKYWLCHGTLLGVIRDRKLIEWDHDIDVALWENKKIREKILKLLKRNGYKLRKGFEVKDDIISFSKKGGRIVDINFYIKKKLLINDLKVAYIKWYVPGNFFCKLIDALSNARNYNGKFKYIVKATSPFQEFFNYIKNLLISLKLFYREIGYSEPEHLLKKIKTIKIENLNLKIPYNPEKYLEYLYGKKWRIPKKNYIWHKDSHALVSQKNLK